MVHTMSTHKGKSMLLILTLVTVLGVASIPAAAFEGILSAGLMINGGNTTGYLYSHIMMSRSFMLGLEFNPHEYSIAGMVGQTRGIYGEIGWATDGSAVPKYADLGVWGRTFLTHTAVVTGLAGASRQNVSGTYDLKLAAEMVAPISDYVYVIGGAETSVLSSPSNTRGWLGIGLAF